MARSETRHRAIRRLQGLAFLGVIVLLLGLTVVIYNKKLPWQSSDEVTLDAARIGNQLIIPADVKYEGVLVGRVSSVHSDGNNATQRGAHHGETQRRDAAPDHHTDEQYVSTR